MAELDMAIAVMGGKAEIADRRHLDLASGRRLEPLLQRDEGPVEIDGGLETLEAPLPAIVTAALRLNQPRYASLPGIMKAKKKPIAETTPQQLGVDTSLKVKVVKLSAPPARKAGIMVPDVATLIDKVRNEAKVL